MGGLTDGVNTRDMAEAFAVFPNQGIYTPSRTYTKVLDADGKVLLENKSTSEVVLKDSTAYYMNTMLQNVVAAGTGYEARVDGMHVAGKTGSTTSDHDRWFAGYTPYYTAVVWTGYESPERVRSSGKNPAAVTFSRVMSRVHRGLPDKNFFSINDLVTTDYCLDSGLLPTDACRTDVRGNRVGHMTLLRDDAPTTYCTRHGESAMVTVCLDSPILNDAGEATGLYHVAGAFCPADRQATLSLLNYERQTLDSVFVNDAQYTAQHLIGQGTCSVHTTAPIAPEPETPGLVDPDDPSWSDGDSNPDETPDTPADVPPVDEPFVPATP